MVHYTTAAGDPNADTPEHIKAISDSGEKAYEVEVSQWGFPPPLDDGDGKTDIYVYAEGAAVARSDTGAAQTSGYITYSQRAHPIHIPHEFFHLIQFGIYSKEAGWLVESTADWAAVGVANSTSDSRPFAFVHPEIPLDCLGPNDSDCAGDRYGYRGNVFFELMTERYGGPAFVRQLFERAAALGAGNRQPHGLQVVEDVLAAHGTNLVRAWNDYGVAGAAGQYTLPRFAPLRPSLAEDVSLYDGDNAIGPVPVDHLAVKYVGLTAADNCGRATLRLTATVPAGVPAEPAFVAPDGAVTKLTSGQPTELPWNGCDGSGTLVLPNPSTSVDAAPFSFGATVIRASVPAPRISLKVPRAVTLKGKRPKLSFKVKSSGQGRVRIVLASSRRVKAQRLLRRGTNKVSLVLPRKFKAGVHKLTATPYSSTGAKGSKRTAKVRFKRSR